MKCNQRSVNPCARVTTGHAHDLSSLSNFEAARVTHIDIAELIVDFENKKLVGTVDYTVLIEEAGVQHVRPPAGVKFPCHLAPG